MGESSGLLNLQRINGIAFILFAAAAFVFPALNPQGGTIKGKVTASSVSESTVIPGANLKLVNTAVPDRPLTKVSNDSGEFIFTDLPSGTYTLHVEASGFPEKIQVITLGSGAVLTVDINLAVTIGETVDVRVEEGLLSTSETAVSTTITSETLKSEPFRDDNYQNAIALTPGVVRSATGENVLKGARPGQSGYKVNGADVTDPVTGKLAFEIPLEAAATVEVEESPYSVEHGHFTGGITNLQTKGGGTKFKVSAARFFPTFRNVFSTKIDSFRPRLTFSGPLIKERLFFLQSFEYRFRRDKVTSLPKPNNSITTERFSSFTQFDWVINQKNTLKFNAAIFPGRLRNLNLDTFNPPEATPNYKQRGSLFSISEQLVFRDASFLSSEFSLKSFDVEVFAKSDHPFEITPLENRGGYFADTRRNTTRWQWRETYYSRPLNFKGTHMLKAGFEMFSTNVTGRLNYSPIHIRRLDETLSRKIEFRTDSPIGQSYRETGFYVQDRWNVNPEFSLEYGIRFDRDGVTNRNNLSPRLSLLYSPSSSGKTVFRGGIGIFFDRASPIGGSFENEIGDDVSTILPNIEQLPKRIVTGFAADGSTVIEGPYLFTPLIEGTLHTPRSIRWSLQFDQAITNDLTVRLGYLRRKASKEMIFEPSIFNNAASLLLSSRGRSSYEEVQFVAAYNKPGLGSWSASYVYSRSKGDLNTVDNIYGDSPLFNVVANEFARSPFDSPHRFLIYGQLDFKYDIRIAPLLEIRSGFPYTIFDDRLEAVGSRNAAGRFPSYVSLDLQITKGFKVPFFDNKRARIGIGLFNVTNHFNPRDVQTRIGAPDFGSFYNSLGTELKAKFEFDF